MKADRITNRKRFLAAGLLSALLLSLALVFQTQMTMARPMKADNSYVRLQLPASFVPQKHFAGFFSKGAGATIMVLDLPREAYVQFTDRFDKELEKKGYSVVHHGKLAGRHDDHLFFYARQHTPVGQFDKYLLIFKDSHRAAYVTITVNPIEKVETPLSYIEAKNILAKVSLDKKQAVRTSSYRLTFLGAFKKSGTVAGSTTIFSLPVKAAKKSGKAPKDAKPMFVIAPSLSKHKVVDLAATGRALMKKFSRFRDMKLKADEEIIVDGLKGYGLSGSAINKSNNKPVGVYQLILANPKGGYFRIVGVAPRNKFPHFLEQFRTMAASFRLTR